MSQQVRFCGYCGGSLALKGCNNTPVCSSCGDIKELLEHNAGPSVLVLTLIFAKDRTLLMKRGLDPYRGTWAPPGGFVERGESLEAAAIREVMEEVGVQLNSAQLMPRASISLPKINQIYCVFIAHLDDLVEPSATPPESLEARWFTEAELSQIDLWEPAANLDTRQIFETARARRFEFLQQADDFLRVFTKQGEVKYLWRRN